MLGLRREQLPVSVAHASTISLHVQCSRACGGVTVTGAAVAACRSNVAVSGDQSVEWQAVH